MRWPFNRPAPALMPEPQLPARVETMPRVKRYAGASQKSRWSDFGTGGGSADSMLFQYLARLRDRSRELQRDNPHAQRYFQLREDNVIGESGITLSSQAENVDGKLDERGNQRVERAWLKWCERPTACGTMTMIEALKLIDASRARDGEVFVEIVRGLKYTDDIALHIHEADMVDDTLNRPRSRSGENEIRMGVEIDVYHKPVAYWFMTYHRGDMNYQIDETRKHRRVPADRVLHIFQRKRAGQTRGVPDLAAAMRYLKMLDGYREAEVTGRRVRSSVGGFFKKTIATPAEWETELADTIADDDIPEMYAEPGSFRVLPPGYELDTFDPSINGGDFAVFCKSVLQAIWSALGVSYIAGANDLDGVSYSGGRQAMLDDRARWRNEHRFLIDAFMYPVFGLWLDNVLHNGTVGMPTNRYEKFYNGAVFSGRSWPWIDPQKDIAALRDALDIGITSHTAIAQEAGQNFGDIVTQAKADRERLKAAGIEMGQIKNAGKTDNGSDAKAGAGGESEAD